MTSTTSSRTTAAPAWSTWRVNPPSATPKDSVMFRNQDKLPHLPVPKMEDTLAKIIKSASAVATSEAELDELKRKAHDFGRKGGFGETLQKRLEARREEPGMRSWIAEWWDRDAYMAYRDSVVCLVSYYFGFARLPQGPAAKNGSDPAYVAASIANGALSFRRLVAQGLLEPDKVGKEGGELCMESFKWAFNSCRVPAPQVDYATKVAEDSKEGQHFIAIRKNRFWKVPVLDEQGKPLSTEELKKLFDKIYAADSDKLAPGVGFLTGINRDNWTVAHAHLLESSKNAQILADIQNSAFVVALDEAQVDSTGGDTSLQNMSERLFQCAKDGSGGEGSNRWWDKPLQWVVFNNGEAGFIAEHSCMDATPTARMNDFITRLLLDVGTPSAPSGPATSDPVPLDFELDSKALKYVEDAKAEFGNHVAGFDLSYKRFKRYGKNGIKKMKTSPDAWFQMMFQLAYYMTFNKFCGTYEAAQVRKFQLGRTETIRTATPESAAWARAMVDSKVSDVEKRRLFAAATKQQSLDVKEASNAHGVDRHLFGWKHLLKDGEEHPFLTDPLLKYSSEWRQSTSQIFIKYAVAYGWGPVIGDGLGLPYLIQDDYLMLTTTCHKGTPGQEYINNWEKAGNMMMDLMESASRESKA